MWGGGGGGPVEDAPLRDAVDGGGAVHAEDARGKKHAEALVRNRWRPQRRKVGQPRGGERRSRVVHRSRTNMHGAHEAVDVRKHEIVDLAKEMARAELMRAARQPLGRAERAVQYKSG